jgi:hypothetical protein
VKVTKLQNNMSHTVNGFMKRSKCEEYTFVVYTDHRRLDVSRDVGLLSERKFQDCIEDGFNII